MCGPCLNDGLCSALESTSPVQRKQVQLFVVKYKVRPSLDCNPHFFFKKSGSLGLNVNMPDINGSTESFMKYAAAA